MGVKSIIQAIKKIKGDVYIGQGEFDKFSCCFNPPATENEIYEFSKKHNVKLPDTYKDFLVICNGMQLFSAGDFALYSLNEIDKELNAVDYIEDTLPIGYVLDDTIILKCGENCIYAGDCCSTDGFYSLECDFETFLDRWIHSNGEKYWEWHTPNEYYTLIED